MNRTLLIFSALTVIAIFIFNKYDNKIKLKREIENAIYLKEIEQMEKQHLQALQSIDSIIDFNNNYINSLKPIYIYLEKEQNNQINQLSNEKEIYYSKNDSAKLHFFDSIFATRYHNESIN